MDAQGWWQRSCQITTAAWYAAGPPLTHFAYLYSASSGRPPSTLSLGRLLMQQGHVSRYCIRRTRKQASLETSIYRDGCALMCAVGNGRTAQASKPVTPQKPVSYAKLLNGHAAQPSSGHADTDAATEEESILDAVTTSEKSTPPKGDRLFTESLVYSL